MTTSTQTSSDGSTSTGWDDLFKKDYIEFEVVATGAVVYGQIDYVDDDYMLVAPMTEGKIRLLQQKVSAVRGTIIIREVNDFEV